jgi:hypothetical protein
MSAAVFQRSVPPPPPSVTNAPLDPSLSDRAALQAAINEPSCSACHHFTDPLGYALGNFAADGAWRNFDHDRPVDATGEFYRDDGSSIGFNGISEFGVQAAKTCEATLALADGFLRAALVINQVPEGTRDALFAANKDRFRQAFVRSGRSYPDLVRAYAQSPLGLEP